MIIPQHCFTDVYCPCEGIARVGFNANTMERESDYLEFLGRGMEDDPTLYDPLCWAIEFTLDGYCMLVYMADNGFHECERCDNSISQLTTYFDRLSTAGDKQEFYKGYCTDNLDI